MKKILIFGGTTEGRQLAERLAGNRVSCVVCVATEYGEQVLEKSEYVDVHMGRMDVDTMRSFIEAGGYEAVIDATHPFATVVTENITESMKNLPNVHYWRLGRDVNTIEQNRNELICFSDVRSCITELKKVCGNILLTTGSKDLELFCEDEELREKLIVRVLPGQESLDLCYRNGLSGKQIIAMQGPFSKEMNLAIIHQYDISCLVTKESGKTGGLDTKFEAAMEAAIPVYLIRKPEGNSENREYSLEEICRKLEEMAGISLEKRGQMDIVLAGIGMGSEAGMTVELQKRLKATDYLFGASRMLEGYQGKKGTYPYYLYEDIAPILEKARKECTGDISVTILFSGDCGFYSGMEKLYGRLSTKKDACVTVLPGISSLAYFSAKLGMGWQDAGIVSTHGVSEKEWMSRLYESVRTKKKTFFITSGLLDVQKIGELLAPLSEENELQLYLGYQLSYENEKILCMDVHDCKNLTENGLYVGMVVNPDAKDKKATPGVSDEEFIRDKVPMTKEEVREVSICKLGLSEKSVVYDIGSGTGSIAIETALLSPDIRVYAIETNPEAVALIHKNIQKFGVNNIEVIEALAPEGIDGLETPDCAFIGGSKGNMREIIKVLQKKNPKMRMVANAVSFETLQELLALEKEFGFSDFSMVQLSVTHTRSVGSYHMMQGENPVWICTMQF